MKYIKLFTLILGVSMLFTSCSKDGATGPAGPTGPTGPAGSGSGTGIKDTVISMTSSSWTVATNYDYAVVSVPQITSAFLAKGEVFVFFSANGGVQWDALNYTSLNPAGYTLDYYANPGNLGLYFGPASNPNTFFSAATLQFRVVFATNGAIKQNPNVNWRDYSQVNALLLMQNKGVN
jgi:hypothetical protein